MTLREEADAAVRHLGWAARDLAGSAGDVADEVLVLLPEAFPRIVAHSEEPRADDGIVEQLLGEDVDDRGDGVVAPEALVERRGFRPCRVGHVGDRRQALHQRL